MQPATTEARSPLSPSRSLTNGQLMLVTMGRLAINTAYRILYPLLPFLALRLAVDLQTVSVLVTVLVTASVASLLGGTLADTRGERMTMSWGLALFCSGALLCALSTAFWGFLAGYLLIGLSTALYQPAAQAYLSARTSYERRGWALGIFETSWAGAALLGVAPLMQLVQATRDSTPVYWVALAAGAVSLALIRFALPPTPRHVISVERRINWSALRSRSVVAMLGFMALAAAGVDMIFVIQSAWLKTSFAATEGQLGQVFGMLGIAELIGSVGSTLLVDRLGKKRAVVGGYVLTALCMLALPLSEGHWLLFLPLFFLFDLFFEFSIVSAFPLASGIAPAIRGTVMALSVTLLGLGRASGSLISAPVWSSFGVTANALVGAGLILAGVLLCVTFVRETEAEVTGYREPGRGDRSL